MIIWKTSTFVVPQGNVLSISSEFSINLTICKYKLLEPMAPPIVKSKKIKNVLRHLFYWPFSGNHVKTVELTSTAYMLADVMIW